MSKAHIKSILWILTITVILSGCTNRENYLYPSVNVNREALKRTVQHLTSITPARSFNQPSSLNDTVEYIKSQFMQYGLATSEQKYDVEGTVYRNVIASYGKHSLPVFVIGAHYDVFDELSGADDNASGIAGVLELARLISETQPALDYRIEFVTYTLEEPPYFRSKNMGSYIHAKNLFDNNAQVLGMASLEMIGYFQEGENTQEYPLSIMKLFYPTVGNFIAVISNFGSSELSNHFAANFQATTIHTEQLKAPAFISGVDFSDHMNYWHFDYDAVMITDTSFYRNPNYHQATDTIDTLDFEKMQIVVEGLYWALINFRR